MENKGSIVLLTTREENVASAVQNCRPYFLRKLSEDYCWSVFAENASFPQSNGRAALEEIGKKIVKKCDGLPLAAETLGRLLRTKHDVEEWNKILMSHIWEFSVEKSKIIPALLISYFHLSPYLKRCFVYCALYPKDYEFEKDELILLWKAEELLPPPKRGESLEEVGCECFDELTSRLFFTKSEDFSDYFVMHDLLHDLAIFLAGDFYCNSEELGKEEEIKIQTRHLFVDLTHCSSKLYNSISKVESLRTLLLFGDFSSANCNIEAATCEILSKCKYLRVLSLTKLDEVPNLIGELIHLRYLDLSWTDIKKLPESLCKLCNLQILMLYGCSKLTTLPSGLHNLVSLRHLDIRKTSLDEMPRKMSKLNQLHVLSSFVVGKHEDNGTQELGRLVNLHESFEIKKLENIVDVEEAKRAKIMDKKHIDELCLEWSSGDDLVSSTQKERDILDNLQPHNGLKYLEIKGYKGTIFPDWLGNCSYENMTHVSLECCKNCCMLPSLGQLPSLKSLSIVGFDQLRSIGEEFYKNEGDHHSSHIAPFPSLETLVFDNMACWEVWHVSESETFPQLKKLEITNCPMLKEEMRNQVFFIIVSSLSDVSKVRTLRIGDYFIERHTEAMFLDGDTLSIRGSESVMESSFKAMISINHLTCLQQIHICECRKLEFPHLQQQKYDLVELLIQHSCDSLTSLSLEVFPNLKNLEIINCWNMESISMSEAPHAALQWLSIVLCEKLVSFAGEGLAAPNLTHLQVRDCEKLEALPRDMKSLLPTLHSLQIYGCPNICRLPEGGLPPNLKELEVGIGEQQMRDLSWMGNLHALTHLSIFGYECKNIKSYPEVGSLPHLPSLTTLHIEHFDNLETLECNELLRLTSLQQLHIYWCPKLENMEGEKLSPSLLLLKIEDCSFYRGTSAQMAKISAHNLYVGEYGRRKASFFCYYFKFNTVLCPENATRRRVEAKLFMKVMIIFLSVRPKQTLFGESLYIPISLILLLLQRRTVQHARKGGRGFQTLGIASIIRNFRSEAPIDKPFAATRSSRSPLQFYLNKVFGFVNWSFRNNFGGWIFGVELVSLHCKVVSSQSEEADIQVGSKHPQPQRNQATSYQNQPQELGNYFVFQNKVAKQATKKVAKSQNHHLQNIKFKSPQAGLSTQTTRNIIEDPKTSQQHQHGVKEDESEEAPHPLSHHPGSRFDNQVLTRDDQAQLKELKKSAQQRLWWRAQKEAEESKVKLGCKNPNLLLQVLISSIYVAYKVTLELDIISSGRLQNLPETHHFPIGRDIALLVLQRRVFSQSHRSRQGNGTSHLTLQLFPQLGHLHLKLLL
ncbi:hypothetical protein AHAS_Ahas12G0018600 [Arachis hypogaea]